LIEAPEVSENLEPTTCVGSHGEQV
jgi:hypothetical protein